MSDQTPNGQDAEIERDVGGVQGTDESETQETPDSTARIDTGTAVTAPDAGEIEWAGELVKKAPGAPNA